MSHMSDYIQFISDHCIRNNLTVAVAESVTAGYIQTLFSRATGASQCFQGGITAYNTGHKVKHLQVEPIHALACNAVSEQVAAEMALGVCPLFNSQVGLSITGYAVPVPELGIHDLFAWYGIALNGKVVKVEKVLPQEREMEKVIAEYATHVLQECYLCLQR